MLKNTNTRNTAIDYLNRDIVNVKNDITNLSKIVRDGNGQPSLIQQVSTISNDVKHLKTELDQEIQSLKDQTRYCLEKKNQRDNLTWQFKTAVIVAVISSITSIILQILPK